MTKEPRNAFDDLNDALNGLKAAILKEMEPILKPMCKWIGDLFEGKLWKN